MLASGAALFVISAGLLGLTFATTGHASPAGPALLAWIALAGGAAHMAAALRKRPAPASVRVEPQPPAPETAPPILDPALPLPELTPLAYDLGLFGLEPDVGFIDVKRAYWSLRGQCDPREQLQLHLAYRRLRRFYLGAA